MKKYEVLCFAFAIALLSGAFQSCVKEETAPTPVDNTSGIVILLRSDWGTCQRGRSICFQRENVPSSELKTLRLESDQVFGKPAVLANGALELTAETTLEQLSEETRFQLLQEKVVVVNEDFTIGGNAAKQAYANSRLTYDGQTFRVAKGVYPVDLSGDGSGPALKIKIKITIKEGEIDIKITW